MTTTIGGTETQIIRLDVGVGASAVDFGGTVRDIANVTKGTITRLEGGTLGVLSAGTITALALGTVKINPNSPQIGTSLVVRGTTGAGVWGTLVAAAGAGTRQYISGLAVIVEAGTLDIAIANGIGGSAGAGVFMRGQFAQGQGIARDFTHIQSTDTNGTLTYWLGTVGTVAMTVNYWQGV